MTPPPPRASQVKVADRLIVLVRGTQSQTINVCEEGKGRGHYERTFRLPLERAVLAEDLSHLADIDALDAFAKEHGGTEETVGVRGSRLATLVPTPAASDPWVAEARAAVEGAISALVLEFVDHPYLHRVEHSVHARLFQLLAQQDVLAGTAVLATGQTTQLLHKEWPEPFPRDNKGTPGTRGLFDLAVLSPHQVEASTLAQFRDGRIQPPLVIEVGLDYGLSHLQKDEQTLLASEVAAPYLLHLNRLPVTDRIEVEALLAHAPAPLRSGYAHVQGAERFVKLPSDAEVRPA